MTERLALVRRKRWSRHLGETPAAALATGGRLDAATLVTPTHRPPWVFGGGDAGSSVSLNYLKITYNTVG